MIGSFGVHLSIRNEKLLDTESESDKQILFIDEHCSKYILPLPPPFLDYHINKKFLD